MTLTKKDKKFFSKAKEISKKSDYPRVHIGCVVVYNKKIVASATNCKKTHPVQKEYNKFREFDDESCSHFVHAEIKALQQLVNTPYSISDVSVYVYRELHNKKNGMARPCPACMNFIMDKGIKNIFYTTDEGYAYEYLEG